MQAIPFQELIAAVGGTPHGLPAIPSIQRIETDSRRVQPGDLFWALVGKRHDGHKFLKQAFANGAVAAVVDPQLCGPLDLPRIEVEDTLLALWKLSHWYRQQFEALVIGVTGSVGKTTTRRLITAVLSARFHGIESPENYNNEYGVPLSLLQLASEHEFAVIELGATQVGEIETLAAVSQPEVGAITAISPAHLDDYGSLENIAKTKSELVAALPSTGFVVLNGDDRHVARMSQFAECPVILVGEKDHNDIRATQVRIANNQLAFRVGESEFLLPAAGRHHLTAALIALAIARQIGMGDAEIDRGMRLYRPLPGRSMVLSISDWTVIDDTYNASPRSMSAACRTLQEWQTTGKRILVTGDMLALGEWSSDFHRLFGEEVARSDIDCLIAVGPQAAIVAGSARKNGMDAGCLGTCSDQDLAVMLLDLWLQPGDVVLVKGSRGMKMEGILAGLKRLAEKLEPAQSPRRAA